MDSTNYFYKIDWEKEERELEAKTRSRSDSELFRGSNDEKKKLNEEFAADGWAGDEMQSVGDVGRSENEQGKGLCLFGLVMLVFITYCIPNYGLSPVGYVMMVMVMVMMMMVMVVSGGDCGVRW